MTLATVRSIADEVVVMKEGRVVEQGPKDEMFTPPHHPYTDLLLSSVPEMDPELADHTAWKSAASTISARRRKLRTSRQSLNRFLTEQLIGFKL